MLLNLINDMMDLAKSEKLKFELNCEYFDLTKTIERAFESLSYFGDQKNIKPKLIIDNEIEIFFKNLNGDEARYS
jgi:signal transduction histidine kinase